jgi:amino acid adenylation domain-containing protein
MTGLLQHYADHQAERRPDAPAVVLGEDALTYGQMVEGANRLARALRESGVEPGDRVCFLMPKSPLAIVAMLAILKAGGIYVPMDPASPAARLAKVLRAADPRLVVAAGPVLSAAEGALDELPTDAEPPVAVLGVDEAPATSRAIRFTSRDVQAMPSEPLPSGRRPQEAAHLLFTSGSTGQPKGVIITHSNVTAFVDWAVTHFGMSPADRVSGHSPLHFDLSTFDVFGAFAAGATLYPVAPDLNLAPARLTAFIDDARLTQWFSVPSILSYMAAFDAVVPGAFPELRRLLWCGEVFPTPQLRYWMERVPHATFTNLYGPTEATIASSYFTVRERPGSDSEVVPIGQACAGEELLVLDEAGQRTPPGVIGRLHIGGVGLSPGYWRDPETTARVFTAHPDDPATRIYDTGDLASLRTDGLVEFHGRADSQIKSRGYRIELGEVEAALLALEGVLEGAIVAVPVPGFESYAICCAYVAGDGTGWSPVTLRASLARALPAYMLPTRWQEVDALPRNANGKVDRPALRAAFGAAA